jgi:peptidoglycan hydrolase-like protein with peptidoglycan-binding domain
VTQAPGEPFLSFADDVAWWDEPPAPALPSPPRAPRPRRRPRTLAGDLARLRKALAVRGPLPFLLVAVLAGVVTLVAVARLALTGEERPAQTSAPPPRSGASETPAPQPAGPAVVRTLGPGDRGAAVRDLQTALAVLGLYGSEPDASFGEGTGAAVAAFQRDRGLVVDGVAGPTTVSSLLEAVAERAAVDAAVVEGGFAEAVAGGRLPQAEASRYGEIVANAVTALPLLRPGRSATVGAVLHDIAAHADSYDRPRALALFTMLATNAEYLAGRPVPNGRLDITDVDGVVYRFFPAHGFQFHPLANFARLNGLVGREDGEGARRLAQALAARGIRSGGAVTWEYYFPFSGPARWTSGLAQAAGAQALARSGDLLGDEAVLAQARGAYRAIPKEFVRELAGGLWIREYGFSDTAILNAQLQSIVSLWQYVDVTGDGDARRVVERMTASARVLLPEFDTGCWSRYSLGGSQASMHYHTYHVSLLDQLGSRTGEAVWSETATRWDGFLTAGGCAAA